MRSFPRGQPESAPERFAPRIIRSVLGIERSLPYGR